MILSFIFSTLIKFIEFIFSFLPNVPLFDGLASVLGTLADLLNNSLGLIYVFIRPSTFKILIDTLFIVYKWDDIYNFIIWVLKKIPALNIK